MNSKLQSLSLSASPNEAGRCCAEWTPLARARWKLAVCQELAEPGVMELVPLRAGDGTISDFAWRCASPTATLMLGVAGKDLTRHTLLHAFDDASIGTSLFEVYRRVCMGSSRQVTQTVVGDWSSLHDVRSLRRGIVVRMTCASALKRLAVALKEVRALTPARSAIGHVLQRVAAEQEAALPA